MAETPIDADVRAAAGGLPHGIAEYAVQIDEGRFTLIVDGPEIRGAIITTRPSA